MDSPMPPSPKERPLELVLECNGCSSTVTLLNGDYEFDVCAIHGGLVRYCTECGFTTVWKRPDAGGVAGVLPARPELEVKSVAASDARVEFGEAKLAEHNESSAAPTPEQILLRTMALEERRQRVRPLRAGSAPPRMSLPKTHGLRNRCQSAGLGRI
jgi:hypothetical protein